ncbi:MAG: hypothetical protein O7G87_15420, partial [bacterium]|nr:hypothetical protein [bacterium]
MKTLHLDLRYYYLPRRASITESEFHHRTLSFQFQASEIALLLVDVWSDHYVKTHLQRGRDITLERIKPVIQAFQSIGATVVHAPSSDCARKYPGWTGYAGDREVFGRSPGSSASSDSWPPAEFRKKSGTYEKWARPQDPSDPIFDAILKDRKIIPEVEPQPGDDVIVTGDQLHRLLSHRKILHLFATGFAANMC